MPKSILFLLFISSGFGLYSQLINLKDLDNSLLSGYDIYLLGEQHEHEAQNIEIALLEKIKTKDLKVLLEGPYDYNFQLHKVFEERDTVSLNFYSFTKRGYKSKLFRSIYLNGLPIKTIDIFKEKQFSKKEILNIYRKHELDSQVRKDIDLFAEAGMLKFPVAFKNLKKYMIFFEGYDLNKNQHKLQLGSDYEVVDEYFEAFRATISTYNDFNARISYMSNFREKHLTDMVKKESNTHRIVSVNGHWHVFREKEVKSVKDSSWIPMGYRLKEAVPDKKVCSFYLLNLDNDKLFSKEFPHEFELISKEFKEGEMYILKITPEGPFKNLATKFDFVGVY